jgi:putative endonuclease
MTKMYFVYVLRNVRANKSYVGHTSDLKRRIIEHNNPNFNPKRYTKKIPGPWELIYKEGYSKRSEAMRKEMFLKSGQGREWLKKLFDKPHFS